MTDAPPARTGWFFVQGSGARSRRPVDLVIVVLGVAVAATCAALHRHHLIGYSLPSWLSSLSQMTYLACSLYVAGVVLVVLFRAPKHLRLAFTVLVAAGLAIAGSLALWVVANDLYALRTAVSAAVLLALRPWVTLPFRRLHALIVLAQCAAAWAAGYVGPVEVVGGIALGAAAASAVLVVLGSPAGHPDLRQVQSSLRGLDIEVQDLRFAERQPWGARVLLGTMSDGPVLVKVYGRDATDAHRAARWWRALAYRDQSSPGATRVQLVEHEALVTILADRAGVAVTPVVAAATSQGDAILVLGAPPEPLDDEDLDDELLGRIWSEVALLHRAGLSHGELTIDNIGAGAVLSGFGRGTVAASAARRAQDVATLLTALGIRIGPERAVAAAAAALGNDDLAAAQPYLQHAALPHSMHGAEGLKATLTALRDQVVTTTGAEPLPPAPITRVSARDLITVALLLLAAYALLTTFAQLDWSTVRAAWANADWRWVALGFVVAQCTAPVDSVSTMSMVPARLPLRPLAMLQYAIKFVGLAISATVGKMAMNTAFLAKFGVGATVAVTASALGSFVTGAVNVLVVLVALPFLDNRPEVDLGGGGDDERLLLLLGLVLVASVVALVFVRPLRRRVLTVVRSSWASIRVVTDSPARGMLLVGSRLASLMITAVALWCMVQGIHPDRPSLGYLTVLVITAGAAAFASIVPVPGNVGVGEAALTAGLVAAGVPSGPAFAIAVTQRLSTSYIPDVIGAGAVRWLRRSDYI
ncbi:lysylphosphatidylglycerol synthase domain-containing protein [Nocardioides sp. SR21]|uniref:lysylphosphatidylglycerol synthase domain-containing protein n=1 Tax=Nocardioides sp. SR21 TaxID=2919501 RepID=UPI001FA95196|nr:lysylphosphatidylglycerol synthase domain-containing protein [Nocardioides sp. SR21]